MNDKVREFYRTAGSIAAQVRNESIKRVCEGRSLLDVAEFVELRIIELGGNIAFPCNISLNDTASHSTPDNSTFKKGDVVKLDIGAHVEGYIADTAITIEVGTNMHTDLIHTAELALNNAIRSIHGGMEIKEISSIIGITIKEQGYNPLVGLTGHELDRYKLHAGIKVPNSPTSLSSRIKTGDVLAIEPFVTYGTGNIVKEEACIYQVIPPITELDSKQRGIFKKLVGRFGTFPFAKRWLSNPECLMWIKNMIREYPVIKERDGNIVAQAEHTLIIDEAGCEVITS